eukprot:gene7818-8630_t
MNILEQLEDQVNCFEVVNVCVEDIFRAFDRALQEEEVSRLEVPMAVNLAMAKIETMVKLATLRYDGLCSATEPFEQMEADPEPVPPAADAWARGTVTTRKVVNDAELFLKAIPSLPSNTPSVSSYRSSVTGRSRTTGTKSRGGTALSRQNEKEDKTGQIFDIDDDDLDKEFLRSGTAFSSTGNMFDSLQKALRRKKDGPNSSSSLAGSQDDEREKGEFDLMQEQIERVAKEMRGKSYVLDRYGQPVPIGKVDVSHLPAFNISPAASVTDANQTGAMGQPGQHNKHHNNQKAGGGGGKEKEKVLRVAGAREVSFGGFEPNRSLAVALSDLEVIDKVNPGVIISGSGTRKEGNAFPEDPQHLSKKVYFAQTSLSSASSTSLAASSSDILVVNPGEGSIFSEVLPNQSVRNNRDRNENSSSMLSQGRKPLGGKVVVNTDTLRNLSDLATFDPLVGSRPVASSVPLTFSDPDQSSGLDGGEGGSHPLSPTRLPLKPSHSQKRVIEQLRGGQADKGIPRDRDLPKNVRNISDRKHLPAPPLGFTTGHGLDKQRVLEQLSSYSHESQGAWHQQWRN